jgi:hypothetical protein
MNYQQPQRMFLARQWSHTKAVWHYGIIVLGWAYGPAVVHLGPDGLCIEPFAGGAPWEAVAIGDVAGAFARLQAAISDPQNYALLWNNCEQFARYVATGRHESLQVQRVAVVAGLALLAAYG